MEYLSTAYPTYGGIWALSGLKAFKSIYFHTLNPSYFDSMDISIFKSTFTNSLSFSFGT